MPPTILSSPQTLSPWFPRRQSAANDLSSTQSCQYFTSSSSSFPHRNLRLCLRIEARASPRKESAKIRNRRLQKKINGIPTNHRDRKLLSMILENSFNCLSEFHMLNGSPEKPRLSVFCSSSQLYAMLIDDQNKKTLFYASTLQKSIRGDTSCDTMEAAQRVGEELVKTCLELKISEISSYDRNGLARGERMRAFETAIAEHGFLPR